MEERDEEIRETLEEISRLRRERVELEAQLEKEEREGRRAVLAAKGEFLAAQRAMKDAKLDVDAISATQRTTRVRKIEPTYEKTKEVVSLERKLETLKRSLAEERTKTAGDDADERDRLIKEAKDLKEQITNKQRSIEDMLFENKEKRRRIAEAEESANDLRRELAKLEEKLKANTK